MGGTAFSCAYPDGPVAILKQCDDGDFGNVRVLDPTGIRLIVKPVTCRTHPNATLYVDEQLGQSTGGETGFSAYAFPVVILKSNPKAEGRSVDRKVRPDQVNKIYLSLATGL